MVEVITLKKILEDASKSAYAVGSFSPRYSKMILPIIEAAIELNSPVIVQISEKEVIRHKLSLKDFANEFFTVLKNLQPQVPIALHLDHTKTIDLIKEAIDVGFTSVMIDASEFDFEKNVEITKSVTDFAHSKNVSVEAELGKIGTTDFVETESDEEFFTVPKEAKLFCELTNVDALAVSVGTAHGIYTVKKPTIKYDILKEINELTDTPLVLHGGSDVPYELIKKSVEMPSGGVSKVNIATDLEQAALKALGKSTHMTEEEMNSFSEEEIEEARAAVKSVVIEKIKKCLMSEEKTNSNN